jgi:TRAP-type C4-dicarboxylate transport system permease small subunit
MQLMKALQWIQVLLLVAFIAYLITFHFQNPSGVVFWTPFTGLLGSTSSAALLIGFLFGLVYALFLYIPQIWKRSSTVRSLQRKVRELEAENAKLRPVANSPVIPDRNATLENVRGKGGL